MEYKYGDRVGIIAGFFQNCEGNIVHDLDALGNEYVVEINTVNGMIIGEPFDVEIKTDLLYNTKNTL